MDIAKSDYYVYKKQTTVIARVETQHYRLKQTTIRDRIPFYRGINVSVIVLNTDLGPVPNSQYGEQQWTTYSHTGKSLIKLRMEIRALNGQKMVKDTL